MSVSIFDHSEQLVAHAKADERTGALVQRMHTLRYTASPEEFDRLIWLLIAGGMCVGGRLVLEESLAAARDHESPRCARRGPTEEA